MSRITEIYVVELYFEFEYVHFSEKIALLVS